MHSSRMRTARLLPVFPSMHCTGGGVSARGGVCSGNVCSRGNVCSQWGVCYRGCLLRGVYPSMHGGRHPPVNRMTDRCKNITFANFVVGGNKYLSDLYKHQNDQ